MGFIYVSTLNTIAYSRIGGKKIVLCALPMLPFSPCDARAISRCPHPEGEPCKWYMILLKSKHACSYYHLCHVWYPDMIRKVGWTTSAVCLPGGRMLGRLV